MHSPSFPPLPLLLLSLTNGFQCKHMSERSQNKKTLRDQGRAYLKLPCGESATQQGHAHSTEYKVPVYGEGLIFLLSEPEV